MTSHGHHYSFSVISVIITTWPLSAMWDTHEALPMTNVSKAYLHAIGIYPRYNIVAGDKSLVISVPSVTKKPYKTVVKGRFGSMKNKVAAVLKAQNQDIQGACAAAAVCGKRRAPKQPRRKTKMVIETAE